MPRFRPVLRWSAVAALAAACGRDAPPPRTDSAQAPVPGTPPGAVAPSVNPGWAPGLGPALLLAADTASDAVVLFPAVADVAAAHDSATGLSGHRFLLFDRAGAVGTATGTSVAPVDPDDECPGRPLLHLAGAEPGRRWTAGIESSGVTFIAFDSLAGLSARDSAARVAAVARIASAFPTTDASFTNLPYDVADARSFMLGDRRILVAIIARRVNREANPLQERTLLIAEIDAEGKAISTWHERSAGSEDDVEGNELLGGFVAGGATYILVAREGPRTVNWSLIERTAPGTWRVRWTGGDGAGGC